MREPKSTRCRRRLERAQRKTNTLAMMDIACGTFSTKLNQKIARAVFWERMWAHAMEHFMEEEWEHEETLRSAYLEEREEFVGGMDEDRFDPPENEDEEAWQ